MASPHFPKKTLAAMKARGISESFAVDTFNSGEHFLTSRGSHMMVKKYESVGYEITLYYVLDNSTGRPIVTGAWKRSLA